MSKRRRRIRLTARQQRAAILALERLLQERAGRGPSDLVHWRDVETALEKSRDIFSALTVKELGKLNNLDLEGI